MAIVPVTEEEIRRILDAPKIIREDMRWNIDESRTWAKCEMKVENKLKVKLDLFLNWNTEFKSKFSIVLLLSNAYRVVGLDYNGSHINRHTDFNIWKAETHIHKWTEKCRDTWAYSPQNLETENIKEAFLDFCNTFNIEFMGIFFDLPPHQQQLF